MVYALKRDLGMIRVCAGFDMKHHRHAVSIKADRLFALATTQYEEVHQIVVESVLAADRIEVEMLEHDEIPANLLNLAKEQQDE